MIARSQKINHPLGIELETPLLIPSFSSKGFSLNNKDVSESTEALEVSKEFLTESLLISAYDIHHKHIPFLEEKYICTEVTFIDSGGYETSDVYDLSTTVKYIYPSKKWTLEEYKEVLNNWPKHKASVIISYDHGKERHSLDLQIQEASALFATYPNCLSDFLIKPESDLQMQIQLPNILDRIHQMKNFSIIGVTEKELGSSILKRMIHIYKLRSALDSVSNSSPIHVFGSLDPITSILYFLAGAEIFDGLTWLKYSYYNGSAIYQSNYGILSTEMGIHIRDAQVKSKSIVNNIYYLEKMKYIMKDFCMTTNYKLFDELGPGMSLYFEKCFNTLTSNLK